MASVDPRAIFSYLVRVHGVSPAVAAGILANIEAESGFRTDAVGDGGTSGGLFQHHAGRWNALKQFAQRRGRPWTDWRVQVDFAIQEARDMGIDLSASDPKDAAYQWTVKFERPANMKQQGQRRAARARNFLFDASAPVQQEATTLFPGNMGAAVPQESTPLSDPMMDPTASTVPLMPVDPRSPTALYQAVLDRLSNMIAGGQRIDPRLINPNGGLLDDPLEGLVPEQYAEEIGRYDWFDPAVFAKAAAADDPLAALSGFGLSFPTGGPGRDGEGGDWFRSGEAPNNFANRNNPLYVARREFAVWIDQHIRQQFNVTGTAGHLRQPHPSDADPGGRSPNSDHYSGGATDYFGDKAELQRLRDWLVQQPFVSFVRWQSESHFDHVHVSYDLGWVAQNWFGRSDPQVTLPDFTTVDQAMQDQAAAVDSPIPSAMPTTVDAQRVPTRRTSAGVRVL